MDPKEHGNILVEIATMATKVDRLISDVKDVRGDIADVKSDLANRVRDLETEKQSKVDATQKENEIFKQLRASSDRIDFLKSRYVWATGVGATISFIFSLVVGYLLTHLK